MGGAFPPPPFASPGFATAWIIQENSDIFAQTSWVTFAISYVEFPQRFYYSRKPSAMSYGDISVEERYGDRKGITSALCGAHESAKFVCINISERSMLVDILITFFYYSHLA